jgi:ERF superfamily
MSEAKTKTLIMKLCEVGASLSYIEKRGKNSFHVYKYATEADIVSAIRLELYARNVFLIPNVVDVKRELIERKTVKDGKEKITQTALTDMNVEWTWMDGESGETIPCHVPGCGEDSGDKGTYKAFTGSEKYLLLKTFLIPTYDDAEQMTSGDKKALQQRIAKEKTAELKSQIAVRDATNPEEAEAEKRKGQVLFVSIPQRFNGDFAAVYGKPITDFKIETFMSDCAANRFKGPEGIFYKLPIQYAEDAKALGSKLGYSVESIDELVSNLEKSIQLVKDKAKTA